MKKISHILIIVLTLAIILSGCNIPNNFIGFAFGTTYDLKLSGGNVRAAKKDIIAMLTNIEVILSTDIEVSDVYKINNSIVNSPIQVNRLTMDMYIASLRLYEDTNGAFNPAISPLVSLWGFSSGLDINEDRDIPSDDSVIDLLQYCSFEYFVYDVDNLTITRLSDRARLDFGAIAKGYAVQQAIEICREYKVKKALINIGGNVGSIGEPIKVGIKSPRESDKICFASFDLSNGESVATSGDYERFFFNNDKRYHHIIDSITGRPVDNGIIGVTVVTDDASLSDAISTAVFAMGAQLGMQFAVDKGAKCLIIMNDNTYYVSPNFLVTIIEEDYTKVEINED